MKKIATLALFFSLLFLSACSLNKNAPHETEAPSNADLSNNVSNNVPAPSIEKATTSQAASLAASTSTPSARGENYATYISYKLGLKFTYAKIDPLYKGLKCSIVETGNKIEDTCGHSVTVFPKDPTKDFSEIVYSLVDEKQPCNIKLLPPLNNFNVGYDITLQALSQGSPSDCGEYASGMGALNLIYFSSLHPDRYIIIEAGGHDPQGVLEVGADGSVTSWTKTIESI